MPVPRVRHTGMSKAPKASTSAPKPDAKTTSTLVLDLGGYSAKVGRASDDSPRILSNCIFKAKSEKKRQFISSQLSECKDQHQLYHMYPFTGGFLTNWELQERVLDYFFSEDVLVIDPRQSDLVVTEPYFNFQSMKRFFVEAIFEDYGFESAFVSPPAHLAAVQFRAENPNEPTCLVVDSGHSFTHIIPVIEGNISWNAVIRIPVGGKILTNNLKQRISFQQVDVMGETHVINQLKEAMCFVSTDLKKDFKMAENALHDPLSGATRTFVLPDFVTNFEGYLKPVEMTFDRPAEHEQSVLLTADRFVVPEILFHPSVIGDARMGISEAAVQVIKKFPAATQLHLFRNVVFTGGSCCFPGFKDRFLKEIAPEVPEFGEVESVAVKGPLTAAWFGGKTLVESGQYEKVKVTKAEYNELGASICETRFVRTSLKQKSDSD